ncbi:MAG: T9SS type A sorting domain-containing protein [Bacteroidia bacterium]|nr:T9SS type A sorting domain-containing protein [Bacteroidia bacterium]
MRRLLSWLIMVLASATLGAQNLSPEVITTAGETYSSTNLYLEWSIGEIMTETYVGSTIWTQGYHQPVLKVTSIENLAPNLGNIKVYPNPSSGTIFIESERSQSLELHLMDMRGRVLIQKNVNATMNSLDLSTLSRGIYILRMSDGRKAIKSVRIEKL